MARLVWTLEAARDYDDACDYLTTEAGEYARMFANGVRALAKDIVARPYFGAEVEKYGREDIRERLFDKYRVIYRIRGDSVEILTVLHGARLLPRRLPR